MYERNQVVAENAKGIYRSELIDAVEDTPPTELRRIIKSQIQNNNSVAIGLLNELLVKRRDIPRYREELEKEFGWDGIGVESESEEEDGDTRREAKVKKFTTTLEPISVGDEEMVARWAYCANCNKDFDLFLNNKRSCVFHPGHIEPTDGSGDDFWDDDDEDCHGRFEDLDPRSPTYAGGFQWDCCERKGDDAGCRRGMHKAVDGVNCVIERKEGVENSGNVNGGKRKLNTVVERDGGDADADGDASVGDVKRVRTAWD